MHQGGMGTQDHLVSWRMRGTKSWVPAPKPSPLPDTQLGPP